MKQFSRGIKSGSSVGVPVLKSAKRLETMSLRKNHLIETLYFIFDKNHKYT